MKTIDKELLLKDLCGRLPYGVRMLFNDSHKFRLHQINPNECAGKDGYGIIFDFGNTYSVNDCKPYLRPMSSMTENEMDRLFEILHIDEDNDETDWIKITWGNDIKFFFPSGRYADDVAEAFDYLNSIHIDYRRLIPKGLALEAPKGMYNLQIKQQ